MPFVAVSPLLPTDTVTVLAAWNVTPPVDAVTVTVVAPAPSPTLDGFAVRVIAPVSSSSMVSVVPLTEFLGVVPDIVIVSSSSTRASSMGVKVMVLLAELLFFGMVIAKVSIAL